MKKVLVVDDDLLITSSLNMVLNKLNYQSFVYNSPIEAARSMLHQTFDLVISDINMPEASGIDFLLWIKKNYPETKVAIITSETDKKYPEIARLQNVVKFIRKPLELNSFNEVMDYCLKDESNIVGKTVTISFFDFIQMIAFLNINKKICIVDNKQRKGFVYIKNGNVNHANYLDKTGESAFYEIIKNQEGYFFEEAYNEPNEISITTPISKLILNSARIKAENDLLNSEKINIDKLKKDAKVLLLDSSDIFNQILIEKYLEKFHIKTDIADSYNDLMQLVMQVKYDLIILDMNILKSLDYGIMLDVLLQNNQDSEIIVFMDFNDNRNQINMKTKVNFIDKPVDIKMFNSLITRILDNNKNTDNTIGTVGNISFSDLMQIIGFDGKKRIIEINDLTFDKKGLVCIEEGCLTYAQFDDLHGVEAFYHILDIKSGLFDELKEYKVTESKKLGLINSLIMNYAEKKDSENFNKHSNEKNGYVYSFSSLKIDKLLDN